MIVKNIDGVVMKVNHADGPRERIQAAHGRTTKRLGVLAREGDHTYYWVRDTLRKDTTDGSRHTKPVRPYWVNTYNQIFAKWRV